MLASYLKKNFFHIGLTFIYAVSVIFFIFFHEVWRDEVRALNYATEAKSVLDLFVNLRNESHPALWHIILYVGYHIFQTKAVLQIFNVVISIAAIFLFLKYSPFSRLQKTLFTFGYFPLYGFSVISRSYALLMLLAILIAIFYRQRFEKPILFSIILFFLANTHILGTIFSFSVFLGLVVEFIYNTFFKKNATKAVQIKIILSFLIIILGLASAYLTARPDENNISSPFFTRDPAVILEKSYVALLFPLSSATEGFGIANLSFLSAVMWLFYFYLFFNKPLVFFISYINFFLVEVLFSIFAFPALRYQGAIFIFFVIIFWIAKIIEKNFWFIGSIYTEKIRRLSESAAKTLEYFLLFLFVLQATQSVIPIYKDIMQEYSSAKRIAQDIKKDKSLENAILMGEPDDFVETLAYYLDNDIYIPRESRFGKTIRWSLDTKSIFSIKELLNEAESLYKKYGRKVIILLQFDDLGYQEPYFREITFGRVFIFSPETLAEFYSKTTYFGDYRGSFGPANEIVRTRFNEKDKNKRPSVQELSIEDFSVYIYPKN